MNFEQTKDRYGRPSWLVYPHAKTGIHWGRVAWDADCYTFQPAIRQSRRFTAVQLREIAEFIEVVS